MRLTVVLALTAVFAVSGAAVAHAISANQFAARASKVCKQTQADLLKLRQPRQPSEVKGYLRKTLKIVRPAQRRLERIPLPNNKRTTARDAIRTSRQAMEVLVTVSRRIDRGGNPLRELSRVQSRVDTLRNRQNRLWRKLGARGCTA